MTMYVYFCFALLHQNYWKMYYIFASKLQQLCPEFIMYMFEEEGLEDAL